MRRPVNYIRHDYADATSSTVAARLDRFADNETSLKSTFTHR
jgi:hypothetical protein